MGTVIYPPQFAQVLHVARKGDEWVGLCGAKDGVTSVVLIAEHDSVNDKLKPGFRWCDACVAKLQKPKRSRS